jgi:hypothetical protein
MVVVVVVVVVVIIIIIISTTTLSSMMVSALLECSGIGPCSHRITGTIFAFRILQCSVA